jgi:hypothetical protein
MAKIDGKIPPIGSKNMKTGDFAWHKRKNSAYLARSVFHSKNNRKNSAYFTLAGSLIKDKASFSRMQS